MGMRIYLKFVPLPPPPFLTYDGDPMASAGKPTHILNKKKKEYFYIIIFTSNNYILIQKIGGNGDGDGDGDLSQSRNAPPPPFLANDGDPIAAAGWPAKKRFEIL